MDKDFEQGIKKVERAVEVKDMEQMRGEQIGQTLEMNEELEERLDLVKKLKRQIRNTNYATIGVIGVLVIILLYACITYVFFPPQTVTEETFAFTLESPTPDLSNVRKTTSDEVIAGLGPEDYFSYMDEITGQGYNSIRDEVPRGITLYYSFDMRKAFYEQSRQYTMSDEPIECKIDHSNYSGVLMQNNQVYRWTNGDHDTADVIETYVSLDEVNATKVSYGDTNPLDGSNVSSTDVCRHRGHNDSQLILEIYQETGLDIKETVHGVLESFPYTLFKADDTKGLCIDGCEGLTSIDGEDFIEKMKDALSDLDYSITYDTYSYSTYDSVERQDERIICYRDGKKTTPRVVERYVFNIKDYMYVPIICFYKDGWLSGGEPVEVSEPVAVDEPTEVSLSFTMDIPDIDKSKFESTTTGELVSSFKTRKDELIYLGKTYKQGDEAPDGVLYTAESVLKAFAEANRKYTLDGEVKTCTSHPDFMHDAGHGSHASLHEDTEALERISKTSYYNEEILLRMINKDNVQVDSMLNHDRHLTWSIDLRVLREDNIDVPAVVESALETLPFATFKPNKTSEYVGARFDLFFDNITHDMIKDAIVDELSGKELVLNVEGMGDGCAYNSLDPYWKDSDIINYHITINDYDFRPLTCALQEHWFE